MTEPSLRIFYGSESETLSTVDTVDAKDHSVTVPLDEILAALADAKNNRRAWLDDFAQEDVTISADLYEIILAYQHLHRPSA